MTSRIGANMIFLVASDKFDCCEHPFMMTSAECIKVYIAKEWMVVIVAND